jgi:quinol monooxygenase YgiN
MSLTVTLRFTSKKPEATLQILSRTLPQTHVYEGCRYVNTYLREKNPQEIILIQSWDTREDQDRYLQWRRETGALQELLNTLASPPITEYWERNDA